MLYVIFDKQHILQCIDFDWGCSTMHRTLHDTSKKWIFCTKIYVELENLIDLIQFLHTPVTILFTIKYFACPNTKRKRRKKTFTQMQNTIYECVNEDNACAHACTPDNRRSLTQSVMAAVATITANLFALRILTCKSVRKNHKINKWMNEWMNKSMNERAKGRKK